MEKALKIEKTPIDPVEFTLLASKKLTELESDTKLQQQLRNGNQQVIDDIFEEILKNPRTLGNFLKRHIADATYRDYEDISDGELVRLIKNTFEENKMKNIGSLKPGATTMLSQRLKAWLNSPVTDVDRQTIFLFCFGLNMDEETASYMLTKTFRTNDFYVRDHKEMIYYYCLKHGLQYSDMLGWLDIYDKIAVKPEEIAFKPTSFLNNAFSDFQTSFKQDDARFKAYLTLLKQQPSEKKKNRFSHYEVFKHLMAGLESALYRKCNLKDKRAKLNCDRADKLQEAQNLSIKTDFLHPETAAIQVLAQKKSIASYQRLLKAANIKRISDLLEIAPYDQITIPENIRKLIDCKLIRFPGFSYTNLKKKLEDRRDPITRSDILFASFLLCTADNDFSYLSDDKRYEKRRIDFEETANNYLESCGYGELYLLNPLELLLVFCLYQKRPFEYFMALWHYAKKEQ